VLSRQRRLLKLPKLLPRRCPWRPQERHLDALSGSAWLFCVWRHCTSACGPSHTEMPVGHAERRDCAAHVYKQCHVAEGEGERNRACQSRRARYIIHCTVPCRAVSTSSVIPMFSCRSYCALGAWPPACGGRNTQGQGGSRKSERERAMKHAARPRIAVRFPMIFLHHKRPATRSHKCQQGSTLCTALAWHNKPLHEMWEC
jgi:hypothetical protein